MPIQARNIRNRKNIRIHMYEQFHPKPSSPVFHFQIALWKHQKETPWIRNKLNNWSSSKIKICRQSGCPSWPSSGNQDITVQQSLEDHPQCSLRRFLPQCLIDLYYVSKMCFLIFSYKSRPFILPLVVSWGMTMYFYRNMQIMQVKSRSHRFLSRHTLL